MDERETAVRPGRGHGELYLRICAAACAGLFLIGLVCAVVLVPRVLTTLDQADQALVQVNSVDWPGLGEAAKKSLEEAGSALEDVDVETLNQTIQDLKTVIEPLARLLQR